MVRLMRKTLTSGVWIILLISLLAMSYTAVSAECPPGYPEGPALSKHIEQIAILDGTLSFEAIFAHGKELFNVRFNRCDGQGRPAATGAGVPTHRDPTQPDFTRISGPDANSCEGCHNQPRSGGAGDFVANVFVLAQNADPVLDSASSEFSNLRNTLGMFGSGAIEMLAREMTVELHRLRDQALALAIETDEPVTVPLDTKGVNFGSITAYPDGTIDTTHCQGIDADLVVKPFHQAGVVVSLRQFTVNAMNHHHGMQAEERFDINPVVNNPDFDWDGVRRELTVGDITAAVIYQAALGVPGRLLPDDPVELAAVERGEQVFTAIGCASCHVPEMRLESRFFIEPNPFNPPGTWSDTTQSFAFDMTSLGEGPYLERDGEGAIVRAYTDLKRHNLCDDEDRPDAIRFYCDEQLAQGRPAQDGKPGTEFFLTRKLWDVGNSAPYGHAGNLTTITDAILMHGGEGRESRDAFTQLPLDDQRALVSFLYSLQVLPPDVPTAVPEGKTASAREAALSGIIVLGVAGAAVFWQQRRQIIEAFHAS